MDIPLPGRRRELRPDWDAMSARAVPHLRSS